MSWKMFADLSRQCFKASALIETNFGLNFSVRDLINVRGLKLGEPVLFVWGPYFGCQGFLLGPYFTKGWVSISKLGGPY